MPDHIAFSWSPEGAALYLNGREHYTQAAPQGSFETWVGGGDKFGSFAVYEVPLSVEEVVAAAARESSR